MKFIHTADLQIGKAFASLDDAGRDTAAVLRRARVDVLGTLGDAAMRAGAKHVLVAGDVYDTDLISDMQLRESLQRMAARPEVVWHLLPGNHDPDRPGGVWDRIRDLPANVRVYRAAGAVEIESGVYLLPAPLVRRHTLDDLTAYMDKAPTHEGALRIGLAHGSVTDFSSDRSGEAHNLIDPRRARTAGLDYLALGDWHKQKRIAPRTWYAGTPEADDFSIGGCGVALVVEPRRGQDPRVETIETGRFHWHDLGAIAMADDASVDVLADRIRSFCEAAPLERLLVRAELTGSLPLAAMGRLDREVGIDLAAALAHLRLDAGQLVPEPTEEDLAAFGGGMVRASAQRLVDLMATAGPQARAARAALVTLFVEHARETAR